MKVAKRGEDPAAWSSEGGGPWIFYFPFFLRDRDFLSLCEYISWGRKDNRDLTNDAYAYERIRLGLGWDPHKT